MSVANRDHDTCELTLKIDGMSCASCVARVEKSLRKVPGVRDASVNLANEKASVTAASGVSFAQLAAVVDKAGYHASPVTDDASEPEADTRRLPEWWPVAVAALLTLPLTAPMLLALFGIGLLLDGWWRWRWPATWTCWWPSALRLPTACHCTCCWRTANTACRTSISKARRW